MVVPTGNGVEDTGADVELDGAVVISLEHGSVSYTSNVSKGSSQGCTDAESDGIGLVVSVANAADIATLVAVKINVVNFISLMNFYEYFEKCF